MIIALTLQHAARHEKDIRILDGAVKEKGRARATYKTHN